MSRKKWFVMLCVGMALGLALMMSGIFGSTALAQSAPEDSVVTMQGLKVEILWGDSNLIRIGRDAPITVRVSSSGAEVEGVARVLVPMGNGDHYVLEEAISVAAGETKQAILCVPVDYYTDTVEVEFRRDDGTLYAAQTLSLRADYGNQEVYAAVISSDVGQLAMFDRVMLNEYRGTTTRLFDFKEDTLPTDADMLKLYDIFLWDDVRQEEISEDQLAALSSWVYDGGVLIIGSDSQWNDDVEDMEILWERWGKGQYVYCGFSLRETSLKYTGESGIRDFLYEAVGEQRMTAIEDSIEDTYSDYWSASNMTSYVDSDRIPQVWQYGLVLLVYLVLLGPVTYYVLKKKKRRNQLRSAMVLLALVFTAIIYAMGSRTRFYRPFMHYTSIREIRSGMLMETVYANLSSPSNSAYSLEVRENYDVSPLMSYDYSSGTAQGESACQLRIHENEEGTQVWIYNEIPFTSDILCLTGNQSSPYGDGFTGEITLFRDGLEGVLVNGTGQDFENVSILSGGRIVLVGDMAAGAEVDLSQLETRLIYSHQQDAILEEIAGSDHYETPGESREASLASWRYRVLLDYFNNRMSDEQGEALVIAFPAMETASYLKDSEMDVQGITLVTEIISVNYEKNGQRYLPMDESRIDVLQGSYHFTRNSTTETLCVLQYDFGDLRADRLLVQWPEATMDSPYMWAFDRGMEFYNWETKTYDYMARKAEYGREELQEYLDENNCLTVRFAMDATEDYYYEIFLPEISAVGREMK